LAERFCFYTSAACKEIVGDILHQYQILFYFLVTFTQSTSILLFPFLIASNAVADNP
jgi:hypothetical protein